MATLPVTPDPVFSWILALACALLLAVASTHKLRQWRDFVAVVENYRIMPAPLAPVVSVLVPLSELSIAALLVLPDTRNVGGAAAALLFMTYGVAIALNLARGRTHMDCGCVAASKRRLIGRWMVWRNAALTLAAALVAVPTGSRAISALDVLTICSSLAVLSLLYAALDQLGATAPRVSTAL